MPEPSSQGLMAGAHRSEARRDDAQGERPRSGGTMQKKYGAAELPRIIALALITVYQRVVSPLFGPRCRFEPSCSRYTAVCIERFGLWRGVLFGAQRLGRCHPFHPGGYDPPPPAI